MARSANDSYFKELKKTAEAQGWFVTQTKSLHWAFKSPDGAGMVIFSGSPGDHRAIKNFVARLRRHGLKMRR